MDSQAMQASGKEREARVREMERRMDQGQAALDALEAALDGLDAALDGYEAALPELTALAEYYDGGDWRRDYEADEAGKLPAGMKRGVLSQDALFDLLTKQRELEERLRKLSAAGRI